MQNSDSGTKANEAAQVREYVAGAEGYRPMYQARALNPGDRVRVRHNAANDRNYSAEQNVVRHGLDGESGSIRERTHLNAYRVAPPGSVERGAWFEADELSPIVTDPDGLEVGGPTVDRPPSEHRKAIVEAVDGLGMQLGTALAEAQGWHSAALLARGEADAAKDALRAVQGEADALRGKLGAAEAEAREVACDRAARRDEQARDAETMRAMMAKLAAERSIHETAALGADKLAKRLADVGAAWGRMRAFLLALPRPLGAAGIEGVDAVDKALGGVAVAEQKAGPAWATEGDPWRAEVEARLGRLEGRWAAK